MRQGSEQEHRSGGRDFAGPGGIAEAIGLHVGMQESQAQRPNGRPPSSRDERFARAYDQLRRPARAMLRRAFGSAFGDDDIEDLYGNAWLGTIRALEKRHEELTDDELRRYVLAAVANQASRELRRRGRKPTTTLDAAQSVADPADLPEERASRREEQELARDVLGSLPPRRRAVLMFRYGWGLEPAQVRTLVKNLSPRAYRKEITRGVDEVGRKLRMVDGGEWCADREPLIKALAAGTADEDQRRQATQHLAHCRRCADYAGRLNGRLHDLGAGVGLVGVLGVITDGRASLAGGLLGWIDQLRGALADAAGRATGGIESAIAQLTSPGSAAGSAGALTKLTGAGAISKAAVACLGTGAIAGACVVSGAASGGGAVVQGVDATSAHPEPAREQKVSQEPRLLQTPSAAINSPQRAPTPQVDPPPPPPSEPADEPSAAPADGPPAPAEPEPEPEPASDPVAAEFEPAGVPPAPSSSDVASTSSSASSHSSGETSAGGTGGGSSDFGP